MRSEGTTELKKEREDEMGRRAKPLDSYPEKTKLEPWHLKAQINYTINTCTHTEKHALALEKAYNLRAGIRDVRDHEHMTKAYGDEFPANLTHIPLARTMLDALIGILREMPFNKHIAVNDADSMDKITERRHRAILAEIDKRLRQKQEQVLAQQGQPQPLAAPTPGQTQAPPTPPDPLSQHELKMLDTFFKRSWKDELEISASHMLNYLRQRLRFDEINEQCFESLFTSGKTHYQVKVERIGQAPLFEHIDSREVFYRKPRHVKYTKELDRVKRVRRIPVVEAINKYGSRMDPEDLNKLIDRLPSPAQEQNNIYDARLVEHTQTHQKQDDQTQWIDEIYCEWKSNNAIKIDADSGEELSEEEATVLIQKNPKKVKTVYRLDRYEGVKLQPDIYVDMGKSKYVTRTAEKPHYCDLTINGVINDDGLGNPYSLVLATADIQDKYDYMFMHWENLVALSGVKAIMWDFNDIPMWMGEEKFDRIKKWLYYLKQGLAIVERNEDRAPGMSFANAGEVDLSLNESIRVIIEMIQFLEETAARVIGVPRQMIGQISKYDGKATTEMAQQSGTLTTKHLFMLQSDLMRCACEDLLNASRIAYSKGMRGAYILGDAQREMFTINPTEFSLADFTVFAADAGKEQQQIQTFQGFPAEFIKGQMIDVNTALDAVTIQSVSELREKIKEGVETQKASKEGQLQQQLEQAMKQIQQLTGQANGEKQQVAANEAEKIKIMREELESQKDVDQSTIRLNEAKVVNEAERIRLEGLQIAYNKQSLEVADR